MAGLARAGVVALAGIALVGSQEDALGLGQVEDALAGDIDRASMVRMRATHERAEAGVDGAAGRLQRGPKPRTASAQPSSMSDPPPRSPSPVK